MAQTVTLEEYMTTLSSYMRTHPNQRVGQAAFNVLHTLAPELADNIRGTHLDPFYNDSRVVAFSIWLAAKLYPDNPVSDTAES